MTALTPKSLIAFCLPILSGCSHLLSPPVSPPANLLAPCDPPPPYHARTCLDLHDYTAQLALIYAQCADRHARLAEAVK